MTIVRVRLILATLFAVLAGQSVMADKVPKLKAAKGAAYREKLDGFYTVPYQGTLKGVMFFVDFDNLPGDAKGQLQPKQIAKKLLDIGKGGKMGIEDFYKQQSYGKFKFHVDIHYEWIRMKKKKSKTYPGSMRVLPKEYIKDAYLAAQSHKIDLTKYHIVYVVAPKGLHRLSPQHCVPILKIKNGKKLPRVCVTFGDDGQSSRIQHLVHETAHGMGLPDLYPYGPEPKGSCQPGPWDIMCNNWKAMYFNSWHRHLWGWLDDSRKKLIKKGQTKVDLAPLDAPKGTAMVVIPAAGFPSEVLVVENPTPWNAKTNRGVLIYRVSYSVKRGQVPVQMLLPPGVKTVYGKNALWQPGQTYTDEGAGVSIKVVRKSKDTFNLNIEKK